MKNWFRHSLLSKYVLIICGALLLLPLAFILVPIIILISTHTLGGWGPTEETAARYGQSGDLERMWHREAAKLEGEPAGVIDDELRRLKALYPEAGMLWVDESGRTRLQLLENRDYPDIWSVPYTIRFMKERTNGDPFTIVAFIGKSQSQGFMIFELPRDYMKPQGQRLLEGYSMAVITGMLLVLGAFLFISFVFFNQIRRRLVRLQWAMTQTSDRGIPDQIIVQNKDEIGLLEAEFNVMVNKLERSRAREAEEEELRRDLISKLSHDLRTPLTTIRSHAYSLREEQLSDRGVASTLLIERKIEHLSGLIENLFSYSLLSAGKYPYRPQSVEMVRTVRTLFASWYPVFEQHDFTIELLLPETAVYWQLDPAWLERVLDNYFQNVLRHAGSGRYIGLEVTERHGGAITITDHGPGMSGESAEKGAGLGLSIIALMLKEMGLSSTVASKPGKTVIRISPAVRKDPEPNP